MDGLAQRRYLESAHAVWLLSAVSALHRKSFDAAAVARECAPPLSLEDFLQIADRIGYEASVSYETDLRTLQAPLLLELMGTSLQESTVGTAAADTPATGAQTRNHAAWIVLLQVDASALILEFGGREARRVPFDKLAAQFTGTSMTLKPKPAATQDPDAAAATRKAFGFRWFVPELKGPAIIRRSSIRSRGSRRRAPEP